MAGYFYARREKFENGIHYLEVPLVVNLETADANRQRVRMVKIGRRRYPCVFAWIPESYYPTHRRDLESTARADERSRRCLVPSGNGRIRCPESNRCARCSLAGTREFDNGHDTSLDALMEADLNAESGDGTGYAFDIASPAPGPEELLIRREEARRLGETLDAMAAVIAEKKPRYGAIFAELRRGETNASEIARRCGLKPNRAAEDVRRVRKLAREIYTALCA